VKVIRLPPAFVRVFGGFRRISASALKYRFSLLISRPMAALPGISGYGLSLRRIRRIFRAGQALSFPRIVLTSRTGSREYLGRFRFSGTAGRFSSGRRLPLPNLFFRQ
jgi:hypothetical protein